MSLAFEFHLKGFRRWHKAVDYILEKVKGPVLVKLCTIKLLELNLNFGLKLALAWRLGSFTEKHDIYNHSQHALPGKWCQTPALNKTLTFNLMMETHHDGDFGDYDAIASFDRLAISIMIQLALRVGAVLSHAVCCYNIFQTMEYSISIRAMASPPSPTPPQLHIASKILARAGSSPLYYVQISVTSSLMRSTRKVIPYPLTTPRTTVNVEPSDTVINL